MRRGAYRLRKNRFLFIEPTALPTLPQTLPPGRLPHVRDFRVHGLNTTFFQCFSLRPTRIYRERKATERRARGTVEEIYLLSRGNNLAK